MDWLILAPPTIPNSKDLPSTSSSLPLLLFAGHTLRPLSPLCFSTTQTPPTWKPLYTQGCLPSSPIRSIRRSIRRHLKAVHLSDQCSIRAAIPAALEVRDGIRPLPRGDHVVHIASAWVVKRFVRRALDFFAHKGAPRRRRLQGKKQ